MGSIFLSHSMTDMDATHVYRYLQAAAEHGVRVTVASRSFATPSQLDWQDRRAIQAVHLVWGLVLVGGQHLSDVSRELTVASQQKKPTAVFCEYGADPDGLLSPFQPLLFHRENYGEVQQHVVEWAKNYSEARSTNLGLGLVLGAAGAAFLGWLASQLATKSQK